LINSDLTQLSQDGGWGNANGMSNLGNMYAIGRGGLPKDEAQAVASWRKAADGGNVISGIARRRTGATLKPSQR
jgi:TPR repeat protein